LSILRVFGIIKEKTKGKTTMRFKVASFFAGVGGIDLGFEQTRDCRTIYANEFDDYAATTFEKNFGIKVDRRDIREIDEKKLQDFDILLAGFPCQAFSIAGYRQGFDDEKGRGNLFFELVRIIKEKQPRVCFFENVKNLVGHDNGNTFKVICQNLDELGYKYKYQVMNACEYANVPHNRERIYIVAFKNDEDFNKFEFPEKKSLTTKVEDIIDFCKKYDEKYYYTEGKYKGDIYKLLVEAMEDDKHDVYQWRRKYVRKNQNKLIPCLTANQGEGGHNVCIVKTRYGIRKMTPRECFLAQGFPQDFKLPEDMSDGKLYKQAGNSVVVPMINCIAQNIMDVL
jgi:DNA (cytosine-5)-methyltransferase 1